MPDGQDGDVPTYVAFLRAINLGPHRKFAKAKIVEAVEDCGFTDIRENVKFPEGVEVNYTARDQKGDEWHFDVSGGFTSSRPGLKRTDTLWKALGKAAVLHVHVTPL